MGNQVLFILPHVVLHVGRTADYLYYTMELADDQLAGRKIDIVRYEPRTLKVDLARHKRLSADDSIRLGLSLTEALEALHARGLSHRDIKPSNIYLTRGHKPLLLDFGAARQMVVSRSRPVE